jgi:hypothetical protein
MESIQRLRSCSKPNCVGVCDKTYIPMTFSDVVGVKYECRVCHQRIFEKLYMAQRKESSLPINAPKGILCKKCGNRVYRLICSSKGIACKECTKSNSFFDYEDPTRGELE